MRSPGRDAHHSDETIARSVVKTLSYRAFVVVLDFLTTWLFTRKVSVAVVAVGFTVASNAHTTLAYLLHGARLGQGRVGPTNLLARRREPRRRSGPPRTMSP